MPTAGAAALGRPVGSLDEVAKMMQNLTGECDDATRSKPESLKGWMGTEAAVFGPYLQDWGKCQVDTRTVAMFYFKPGKFADFQRAWKAAVATRKLPSGKRKVDLPPDEGFGNGYAISANEEHLEALQLRYLRCEPVDELNSKTVPADVPGCAFAETPGW